MATHKLILDDLENIDYCLYAILTELEDYRLAHAINLNLGSKLNRKDFDLDTCNYFCSFRCNYRFI